MKGLKPIILVAALLLPIFLFLFLKFFGKNEFRVEPLWQTGVVTVPADCNLTLSSPYLLPDSVFYFVRKSGGVERPSLILVGFLSSVSMLSDSCGRQVSRLMDKFASDSVSHAFILGDKEPTRFNNWSRCVFLMSPPNEVALVDNEKRIRGYYDCNDEEDMDRLMTEVAIILKKY